MAQTAKTNRLSILSAALGLVAVAIEILAVVLVVWGGLSCWGRDCPAIEAATNAAVLASFFVPASAVITGIIARRQIAQSQGARKGQIGVLIGIAVGGLLLVSNIFLACWPLLGFLTSR